MELLLFAPADFFLELCATSSRFSACAAGFCVSFGGVHFARSPKLCEISKSESRNFFHYCDFSINTAIIPAPRRPYFCGIAILCGVADWEDASFQINSLFATSVLFICPYLFTPRFFIIAAQKIHLIETLMFRKKFYFLLDRKPCLNFLGKSFDRNQKTIKKPPFARRFFFYFPINFDRASE